MEMMVIIRAVHVGATVLIAGAFAFRFFITPRAHDDNREKTVHREIHGWLRCAVGWGSSILLLTWLLVLVLTAASMSGTSLKQSLSLDLLRTVMTRTTFGQVWMLRFALAVLLGVELLWLRRKRAGAPALGLVGAFTSALLLVSLAWAGHAVGTERSLRSFHLTADALHLLGAGIWLGALAPLFFVLDRARTRPGDCWKTFAATATRRFSTLGVVAMTTILVTGAINAWLLVGSADALMSTGYGQLVSAKLGLFLVIVLIAALNRVRLTPGLQPGSGRAYGAALHSLWRNVILEIILGAAVVGLVAVLGTTPPPFHKHGSAMHQMSDPHDAPGIHH